MILCGVYVGVNTYSRKLLGIKGMLGSRKASSVIFTLDGKARLLGTDLIRDYSRSFEIIREAQEGDNRGQMYGSQAEVLCCLGKDTGWGGQGC